MTTNLSNISDNKGARHRAKLLGRGIGSGKGKTSGRGGKGQTARTGVAIKGFEGGQTPIHRRLPKRGFKNPFKSKIVPVNTGSIQKFIDAGKLDAKKINTESLLASGLIRKSSDGLKLLAKGELKTGIQIEVDFASEAAIKAVEKAGGKVTILAPKEEKVAKAPKADKKAKKPSAKTEE